MITISIIFGVCWILAWFGFSKGLFVRKDPLHQHQKDSDFSIIIPARNEEKNLQILLKSILKTNKFSGEIIVVDDGSTDSTAHIASSFGVTVVTVKDKPDGWTGKTFACWTGAITAKKDNFIFVDADTFFEESGIETVISKFSHCGGLVSFQPFHKPKSFIEEFSLLFNILILYGVGIFSLITAKKKLSSLFGPCMICSRTDYFAIDGHRAIKNRILENLYLSRICIEKGISVHGFSGKSIISFRMYSEGIKSVFHGWAKGFSSGASASDSLALGLSIFWISSLFLSISLLILSFVGVLSPFIGYGAFIISFLQLYIFGKRVGSFSLISAVLYPIHAFFFIFVFCYSWYLNTIKKTINWKGHTVKI